MPAHKKPRLLITCDNCGAQFYVLKKRRRFCSHTCANQVTAKIREKREGRSLEQATIEFWAKVDTLIMIDIISTKRFFIAFLKFDKP